MSEAETTDLRARIEQLRERLAEAERRYARPAGSVALLAASKAQTVDTIRAAARCGLHLFGENYLQEAEAKIGELPALCWHYIGPLQANKTRKIAQLFQWVHGVARFKIAARLSDQRQAGLAPLPICLQVNINRQPSKAGVTVAQLPALAEQVAELDGVRLRGLMAIPAAATQFDRQRRNFAALRAALEDLNRRGHALDTLSMGMSADLEAAVAEGATIVRIGTAIFGPRKKD